MSYDVFAIFYIVALIIGSKLHYFHGLPAPLDAPIPDAYGMIIP